MRLPKMFIETEEELLSLAREWQKRLLLSDWIINFSLVTAREMSEVDLAGESDVQWINRCGVVNILRKEEIPQDIIAKQPMELVLVHELLHFKFMMFDNETLEGCYFSEKQHQLLEDIAKSLYMAKYGLDFEWFKC